MPSDGRRRQLRRRPGQLTAEVVAPAAEITCAETGQRAQLLRVRSYDVALDLTRGAETFGSVSVVRFDCADPGAASHADLAARAVHEITLNGVPLDPAAVYADSRIALPALAARNELRVVADCAYTGSGTGLHRSADPEDGGTYIYGEMAHMWFGDLVTQQWWDDLWLSESFAEFCAHDAMARLGLFPGAWPVFSVSRKIWGFTQDRLPSTHPVASGAATLGEAIASFDGISYAKGASVLRQLAAYVGEENFFAGLRAYLAGHAYANARLPDLIAAVAASSDRDLAAWSRAWLETAGPNTLRCEFLTDAGGAFTEFAVAQDAPVGHPVLWPHRLAIGLYSRSEGGRSGGMLARTRRVEVEVAGARTEVPELAGVTQPDLILPNDDDTGYVLARLDARSLRTATESAGELAGPSARAVCWAAVIDMVRQAELPVSAFVAMLADGMRREPSVSVLQALFTQAEQILSDAGIDAELARDPTDAGRRGAAACRAAIPDAGHKEAAWQLLTGDRLGPESLSAVARGFTQPEQAALLVPYAGRYLDELERIWATRDGHLRVRLGELLFPYPAASPDLLARIDEFLARPRDPGLARVLADHRDTVQRALRSRALPG